MASLAVGKAREIRQIVEISTISYSSSLNRGGLEVCWVGCQKDGIQKAKERGVRFGRRKNLSSEQIIELQSRRKQGFLIRTLMKDFAFAKSSVYRYLKEAAPVTSTADS